MVALVSQKEDQAVPAGRARASAGGRLGEAGTSHWELLRAFADDATLARMALELDAAGYRHHEFGDSVLLLRPLSP